MIVSKPSQRPRIIATVGYRCDENHEPGEKVKFDVGKRGAMSSKRRAQNEVQDEGDSQFVGPKTDGRPMHDDQNCDWKGSKSRLGKSESAGLLQARG